MAVLNKLNYGIDNGLSGVIIKDPIKPNKDIIQSDNDIVSSDKNIVQYPNEGSTPKTGTENQVGTKTSYSAEENKAYYDATKTAKEAYSPNAEGYTNTGTGAESAIGTKYSWEDKAQKLAGNTYSQKVLEEKQNLLTNRQTMEQNAQQYQTQADMKQYSDNQAADKVGWTGGYVLDQERQQEYLKASIQAQLYGAMELQKYGYDTAMSAARLAYDSNMVQYAQEYYNQAVQNSLNEAQITGTYFSAEVKDMLGQNAVAEQAIKDYESKTTHTDEEEAAYERAKNIKGTIRNWFEENHISEAGIKTLESWNAEQSLELQWSQDLWTKYQAAIEATKEDVQAANKFWMLDENGNIIYDGASTKVGDWDLMTAKEKLNYATTSEQAASQLTSYLEYDINQAIAEYRQSVYDEKEKKYNIVDKELTDAINRALEKNSKELSELIKNMPEELEQDKIKKQRAENVLTAINDFAKTKFRENLPTESYDKIGQTAQKTEEPTATEKNTTEVSNKYNVSKSENYAKIKEELDTLKNNNDFILAKNATESDFGSFNGSETKGDSQYIWVNTLIKLAKEGKLPDGSVVRMNVGQRAGDYGDYIYSEGRWYKLSSTNTPTLKAEMSTYSSFKGAAVPTLDAENYIINNLKELTGKDYSTEIKKYFSEKSEIK